MPGLSLLNFDKDGMLLDQLPTFSESIKRVVLVTHGWHEDQLSSARDFTTLITAIDAQLRASGLGADNVAYVGVIWPSDKYAGDLSIMAMRPDVAAPPSPEGVAPDVTEQALLQRASDIETFLGTARGALSTLAIGASQSQMDQDQLVDAARTAQKPRQAKGDSEIAGEHPELFGAMPGHTLVGAVRQQFHTLLAATVDKVKDNPLIEWLHNVRAQNRAIIASTLNLFAYNELKIRAGLIGAEGVAKIADALAKQGLAVHLVGHSFGARVMTSAANAATGEVASLTLLEGAYSHNGLSQDPLTHTPGAFRGVVDNKKVSGPIVAICSKNDTAVWVDYPLASRVFRDTTSLWGSGAVFGGPTDRYGAMGANGPLIASAIAVVGKLPPAPLVAGNIYTVDATSFVSCHTDVWNDGCAGYIAAAMSA